MHEKSRIFVEISATEIIQLLLSTQINPIPQTECILTMDALRANFLYLIHFMQNSRYLDIGPVQGHAGSKFTVPIESPYGL